MTLWRIPEDEIDPVTYFYNQSAMRQQSLLHTVLTHAQISGSRKFPFALTLKKRVGEGLESWKAFRVGAPSMTGKAKSC